MRSVTVPGEHNSIDLASALLAMVHRDLRERSRAYIASDEWRNIKRATWTDVVYDMALDNFLDDDEKVRRVSVGSTCVQILFAELMFPTSDSSNTQPSSSEPQPTSPE